MTQANLKFDYSKLCGRIVEKCKTQGVFSEKMGKSERTISLKLNNKIPWTQMEILKASDILDIPVNEVASYFFYQSTSNL